MRELQHEHLEVRRGSERPRIIRTGNRGRPKKEYRMIAAPIQNDEEHDHKECGTNSVESDEDNHFLDAIDETARIAEISITTAMASSQSREWMDGIVSEVKSLLKNDTWEIIDHPQNRVVVGSRMILTNKLKPDGTLDRRKARLVAKGHTQRKGIDFTDTFATVARLESVRMLVAIAVRDNLVIHQMDIVTAYLNGYLNEEVYMEKPELLEEPLREIIKQDVTESLSKIKATKMLTALSTENKVCLLKKALFSLRQAGRQ